MTIRVQWLEGDDVPKHLAVQGHIRIFRVISYDGAVTDMVNGSEAAKLAFELQDQENALKGIPRDHS